MSILGANARATAAFRVYCVLCCRCCRLLLLLLLLMCGFIPGEGAPKTQTRWARAPLALGTLCPASVAGRAEQSAPRISYLCQGPWIQSANCCSAAMTDILGLIGRMGGATAEQLVVKLGLPPGHAGVASALDQAREFMECYSFRFR